ncbi:MAG: hypothetical protein ACOZAR_00445 [Patescibacteria group bacterium]
MALEKNMQQVPEVAEDEEKMILPPQGTLLSPDLPKDSINVFRKIINKEIDRGFLSKQSEVLDQSISVGVDQQDLSSLEVAQIQKMSPLDISKKIEGLSEKELWDLGKKLDIVWANEQNKALINSLATTAGISVSKALKVMIENNGSFSQLFGEKNGPSKNNLLENKFGSKEAGFNYLTDSLKLLIDRGYADASAVYSQQNNGAVLSQYDYYKNTYEAFAPLVHEYYFQNGMTGTWRNEYVGTFMPAYREGYKDITKQFAGY